MAMSASSPGIPVSRMPKAMGHSPPGVDLGCAAVLRLERVGKFPVRGTQTCLGLLDGRRYRSEAVGHLGLELADHCVKQYDLPAEDLNLALITRVSFPVRDSRYRRAPLIVADRASELPVRVMIPLQERKEVTQHVAHPAECRPGAAAHFGDAVRSGDQDAGEGYGDACVPDPVSFVGEAHRGSVRLAARQGARPAYPGCGALPWVRVSGDGLLWLSALAVLSGSAGSCPKSSAGGRPSTLRA